MAIKHFLIIVAKNAVNAIITNAGLMATMHGAFNTYSRNGLWNLGKATLSVVVAREVMVWGPVVVKWSMTNASPDDLQKSLKTAADANIKSGQAISDAQSQSNQKELK
jgi:hypothetical protein